MSKQEVCDFLGKSKRTVEGYVKAGRLGQQYVDAPNGVRAIFERADVVAFKESAELAPVARPALVQPDLAAHLARLSADPVAVLGAYVTLDEAAKRSGMPKAWLIAQAKAGVSWAVNAGSEKRAAWRFRIARETVG